MSRGITIDYFNLVGDALTLAGGAENKALSEELGTDEYDNVEQIETYGAQSNPTNDYSVKADYSLVALILGQVFNGYFLTGFTVTTAAGAQPKLSVTGANVPAGDSAATLLTPPAGTVKRDWAAQILFGAFTLSGSGCHVKQCTAKASATFSRGEDGLSEPNCSNICGGVLEVTAEIEQLGATAPTVTAADNWTQTGPLDPKEEKGYKKFSVGFKIPLTASFARGARSPKLAAEASDAGLEWIPYARKAKSAK